MEKKHCDNTPEEKSQAEKVNAEAPLFAVPIEYWE